MPVKPLCVVLQQKKEVAGRVRDLSAAIRERNLAVVGTAALRGRSRSPSPQRQRSNASPSRARREASPPKRQQSARERGVQYARALPARAEVSQQQQQLPARRSASPQKRGGSGAHAMGGEHAAAAAAAESAAAAGASLGAGGVGRPTEDLTLRELRALHAQQKAMIEAMRRDLGSARLAVL
jgi:hypothetical protein